MDLRIQDVAKLLRVSETTVKRWLSLGKIPSYRLDHQYRFSRTEIEDWVLSNHDSHLFESDTCNEPLGPQAYGLYRSLHKGAFLKDVPGKEKEAVIRESVAVMAETLVLDANVLTDLLLDRERLMPTSLGCGIAVPHTRDFLFPGASDFVSVVYLKDPIEYGALDGKKVHTLFFLFACEDKTHLHLLAKLAHFVNSEQNREFLAGRPEKKELLQYVKLWEEGKSPVAAVAQ
ncbi:MAG: PTS sugar transporter subunit IIA [Chlamydiota bacterium]